MNLNLAHIGRTSKLVVVPRPTAPKQKTTVSIPEAMYEDMLRLADNDPLKVSEALRRAALKLKDYDKSNFSGAVRDKALAILRGSFIPERQVKEQLFAMYLENKAGLQQLVGGA